MNVTVVTPKIVRVEFSPDGRGASCVLADGRRLPAPANRIGSDGQNALVAMVTSGATAYARLDGRIVFAVVSQPETTTTYDESDFQEVERVAASTGQIFGCETSHPNGAGYLWRAWMSMPRERSNSVEKLAMETARRAKWAGKTAADVRVVAEDDYQQDAYGQTLEHEFLRRRATEASSAGVDCAEILAECEREDSLFASAQEKYTRESAVRREARTARLAPHMDGAMAAVAAVKRLFAPSQIPDAESVAEKMADGQDGLAAATGLAEARRKQEGPDCPDTFGYCHGTDFDGGTW